MPPSKPTRLPEDSPFKRPYVSRRKRKGKISSAKVSSSKLMLRVLAVLVVLLLATLFVIFKDVGKSSTATGTLTTGTN